MKFLSNVGRWSLGSWTGQGLAGTATDVTMVDGVGSLCLELRAWSLDLSWASSLCMGWSPWIVESSTAVRRFWKELDSWVRETE